MRGLRTLVAGVGAAFAVLAATACSQPQTVDLPSPSPFMAPRSPSYAPPSLYNPPPGSTGRPGEEETPASPSLEATGQPPSSSEPQPDADVAGIRCGDEDEERIRKTTVVTRTTCYEVEGTSMPALDAQMRRKGPRVDGRHAIAVTRWLVRWSYDARSTASGCELIAPSIETVAVYRFPTWEPPDSVAEGTVSQYRAFIGDVRVHEGHHRELAVNAGVSIRRALLALPVVGTCAMLEKEAGRTFDDVFARFQAKQRAFDEAAGGISY